MKNKNNETATGT